MIANGEMKTRDPAVPDGYREQFAMDGSPLESWSAFLSMVETSSPDTRAGWHNTIRRELREDGLTFTVSPDPSRSQRTEDLNPVPWIFTAEQWRPVESGIRQRAALLQEIACDLLGPRKLISEGLLPAELIFSDPHYLHPCIGLPPNMDTSLFQYAADLARGSDGGFRVVEDRTQAPSGAGYALESRTILGRVFPKLLSSMQVRRLAPYFRNLRESMLSLYRGRPLEPRVVLLTPGPYNPSYFEHAYLAAYLGYTLVQGNDLLVRNGSLKLKTLEGLQPVDILYRHVDAAYLDPLELRRDSILGVPGLLGAMRSGRVATLNHPGCGLLENAGLMAFLAPLCRRILGEDLLLPSVATWWCGQAAECSHVLENLDRLILKPLHRKWDEAPVDGRFASADQLTRLRDRIRSQPAAYVAQEPMSYSSLPSLTANGVEERVGSLRSFAFASRDGYQVMPGALARTAETAATGPGGLLESKGSFKDVWVLGEQPQEHRSLWLEQPASAGNGWFSGVFTSRSAENLFWVGRYAERITRQTRTLRGILQMDQGGLADEHPSVELARLTELLEDLSGWEKPHTAAEFPHRVQCCLNGAPVPHGNLQRNLQSLLLAAYTVRDIWSQDSWRLLVDIREQGKACSDMDFTAPAAENVFGTLVRSLNAFYGLNTNCMTRESGWCMLMLGRMIESALGLCSLIEKLLIREGGPSYQGMEQVLELNENLITYRRHYRTTPKMESVLQLILSTEINPRSMVHFLEQTLYFLHELPPPSRPDQLDPVLLELKKLRNRLLDSVYSEPELALLDQIRRTFEAVSDSISSAYFSHTALLARENF